MAVSIAVPEVFDSVLDMIFEASVPTAFRSAVGFIPFSAFAIGAGGAAARQRLTVIWEHSQTAPSFLNLMMVFDCLFERDSSVPHLHSHTSVGSPRSCPCMADAHEH